MSQLKRKGHNEAQVLINKRITVMKKIMNEIKKAMKAFVKNYINAMTVYGEAISRGRGCACA